MEQNTNYLEQFRPDLAEFREKTMKFHNGEITQQEYKGFSGGYGSYAQRGGQKHMLRLRMAGGRLTLPRLAFIAEACKKYDIKYLKLTTCQSVQLHNLEAADLCELIEAAWDAGMISRGGGGDFPRNVMATALTGVTADESFEVGGYAEAAANFLMRYIKGPKFPRKLKVAFSSNEENEAHATFRDLGFVARPDHKFDVYIAGGLGGNPRLGVKVAEGINPAEMLYYIDAMVRTFLKHGNYENRAKARTRYMQEALGADGLKAAYAEALAESRAAGELSFTAEPYTVTKAGAGPAPKDNVRILPQKQAGLYSLYYQPAGGVMSGEKAIGLYDAVKDIEAAELRVTPAEGLYIINLTGPEAERLLAATADSAKTAFDRSVACIGATICQVGLADSQGALAECFEAVHKENFADGVLPTLRFSGCPSSCGAHQTAPLGFRGAMKRTPGGPVPAFTVFLGGCDAQGEEAIADTVVARTIARADIPAFLVELGRVISAAGTTYEEWIKTNADTLDAILAKYTA